MQNVFTAEFYESYLNSTKRAGSIHTFLEETQGKIFHYRLQCTEENNTFHNIHQYMLRTVTVNFIDCAIKIKDL